MDTMNGVFQGFDIIGSALHAEMQRSEIVASNLANMHVTRTADGEPYRRKMVVFEELLGNQIRGLDDVDGGSSVPGGVRLSRVNSDYQTEFVATYDPGHEHANEEGFVLRSNVDMFRELMDMTVIRRSFEANLAAMRSYRGMLQSTITNFRS